MLSSSQLCCKMLVHLPGLAHSTCLAEKQRGCTTSNSHCWPRMNSHCNLTRRTTNLQSYKNKWRWFPTYQDALCSSNQYLIISRTSWLCVTAGVYLKLTYFIVFFTQKFRGVCVCMCYTPERGDLILTVNHPLGIPQLTTIRRPLHPYICVRVCLCWSV